VQCYNWTYPRRRSDHQEGGQGTQVLAAVAVQCKQTELGGGRGKYCEQASYNQQTGHSKSLWNHDHDETEMGQTCY